MEKTKRSKTLHLTLLAMLSAIIVLMAFTPLGYLRIGLVEITFLTVPVVIGAIILGPLDGAILGAVFGLTSFAQCFGISAFTVLLPINPIYTFIMCVVPRIMIGLISGLLAKWLEKKNHNQAVSFALSSLAGTLTNTIFFIGLLVLFFGESKFVQSIGDGIFAVYAAIATNAIIEIVVCTILGTSIAKALVVAGKKLNR